MTAPLTAPSSRRAELAIRLLLFLALAASVKLWWPSSRFLLLMPSDDTQLMAIDRAVLAGHWVSLVAPQDVHVYPLFRLIRLYFELHFVERYRWLQLVALAAHLISVVLLFILCRRFLRTSWAALLAAVFFAWHALGRIAFLRKADNPYVLSLPFLLGAMYCLYRLERSAGRRWAAGCFLCLLLAVGLHSMAAMLAIPGILLSYYLLAPAPGARHKPAAWLACLLPALAGGGLWVAAWLPSAATRPVGHRPIPANAAELLAWFLDAARGTLWHFAFLARRTQPEPLAVAAAALAFTALLVVVRGEPSFRWILAVAALTVIPVFGTLFVRSFNDYPTSRYFYQSSLLAAVAAASAFDPLLVRLEPRPLLRSLVIALLAVAAPLYYVSQKNLIAQTVRDLESVPTSTREFWAAWSAFFDQAATRAHASSSDFRLPHTLLAPAVYLDEVFNICDPRGKPGLVALPADRTHIPDCVNFWREVKKFQTNPISRDAVLVSEMVVTGFRQTAPQGASWVCRAWADDPPALPSVLPLGHPGP